MFRRIVGLPSADMRRGLKRNALPGKTYNRWVGKSNAFGAVSRIPAAAFAAINRSMGGGCVGGGGGVEEFTGSPDGRPCRWRYGAPRQR